MKPPQWLNIAQLFCPKVKQTSGKQECKFTCLAGRGASGQTLGLATYVRRGLTSEPDKAAGGLRTRNDRVDLKAGHAVLSNA